jgi:hypothetical protein
MSPRFGGWDVHTHIVPPAVVAAGERGAFGMRTSAGTLNICAHGVPLHPLSEVGKLVDRVQSDDLDGAIISVPPPLFRPHLNPSDRRDYAQLVNDGLNDPGSMPDKRLDPFYLGNLLGNPVETTIAAANLVFAGHDLGHLDAALRRRIRKTNAEEAFGIRLQSAKRQDMS